MLEKPEEARYFNAERFTGTIVSKHSGLRLTGSSDIDGVFAVNGDITLTGSVDFNGLLFAPNHEINIHGSADIDGSMIAQTVSMTGSSDLTSSTGYYDFLQNPLLGDSLGIGELEFTRVRN
ncbi:DUF2807 domain-containing protein [candidate division NPL-UPA2 bacterium]|nr:DUF2807 domain-containing protein [candidate division NPL-UPA2 bacterium]